MISTVFHRHRHRKGWGGRIYVGKHRFLDIGWFHYDLPMRRVG